MSDKEIVVIIRPSFKKVCENEACRAAALNHMLYWIARKHKEEQDYWYCKGEDMYHGLAESWGISIVRREVNKLIDSNFIGEMRNPTWGVDRTKHFYFHEEQAQTLFKAFDKSNICPLCIGVSEEIATLFKVHLINLTNASDRSITCICQNHQMQVIDLSLAFDRSNTTITKITTKITYKDISYFEKQLEQKEDRSVSANATTDAHAPETDTSLEQTPDAVRAFPPMDEEQALSVSPRAPVASTAPPGSGSRGAGKRTQEKKPVTQAEQSGPPAVPPNDAPWPSPETAVQIVEAKLGKPYRDSAREKQINAAKRMFKEDRSLTRAQFEDAYNERNDEWWHEHKGLLHLTHMVEKDRVHDMLDRIEARTRYKPNNGHSTGKKPPSNDTEDFYSLPALLARQNAQNAQAANPT